MPRKTRLQQTTFHVESLPDNVFVNNTGESGRRAVLGVGPKRREEELVAFIQTYPFETSTALAAAILTLWSGEVDSATAAATAAAVAGVINCGVLEVERRVLGLDAEVEKEDTVISICATTHCLFYEGRRKSVLPLVVFGAIEGEDITVDVDGEAAVVDAAPAAADTPGTVSLFVTVKVLAVFFNGYHGHNYTTIIPRSANLLCARLKEGDRGTFYQIS